MQFLLSLRCVTVSYADKFRYIAMAFSLSSNVYLFHYIFFKVCLNKRLNTRNIINIIRKWNFNIVGHFSVMCFMIIYLELIYIYILNIIENEQCNNYKLLSQLNLLNNCSLTYCYYFSLSYIIIINYQNYIVLRLFVRAFCLSVRSQCTLSSERGGKLAEGEREKETAVDNYRNQCTGRSLRRQITTAR